MDVSSFFLHGWWDSNHLTATVRWTVACRRSRRRQLLTLCPPGTMATNPIIHPIERNLILSDEVLFYMKMGFERPLRKHAGGIFLGRRRIPAPADASGCGCHQPYGDAIKQRGRSHAVLFCVRRTYLFFLFLFLPLPLVSSTSGSVSVASGSVSSTTGSEALVSSTSGSVSVASGLVSSTTGSDA